MSAARGWEAGMGTQALALARTRPAASGAERLGYGLVELSVTSLARAARFWTTVLGFVPRAAAGPGLALGTGRRTLVVLHPGAATPAGKGHAGMYHVAFGVPTQTAFSRMLLRLRRLGVPHAAVDHLMSKAIYLDDPDGHGIEIAFETPERFGCFVHDARGFALLDTRGHRHSGRAALDVSAELAWAGGIDPEGPIDGGTGISHLHLHVRDLEPALAWFEGVGFVRNLTLPGIGFADMGAGAAYTHRLALNLWAGPAATPAPAGMARLLRYRLETPDAGVFDQARRWLTPEAESGALGGVDPAGVSLQLHSSSDGKGKA